MATNSLVANHELQQGHWVIDGTGWSFQAILYDTTKIQHKNVPLVPGNIQLFEYTNQWNALVLTGQLIYKDSERGVGKLFRIPHLLLKIEWAENLAEKKEFPKKDSPDTMKEAKDKKKEQKGDYWVEKPIKKEDYFNHFFLVNKMEIISHDIENDVITYRFELVSTAWYKLSQVCQFSNYNLKKPERITDIICRLLIDAVGEDQVASNTFKEDPCKTDISIYYTTTQHDNYFTAINYLLNRMYMEPSSFDVDNHPRIILWDEKNRMYRMAKLNDDTTCLRVKHNLIQLNRFYQIEDSEVNPYAPGTGAQDIKPMITSLSKMSYTRFMRDFYTRHYWDMNITKDKFVRRIIMNEKIQNTFKSPNSDPKIDTAHMPNLDFTSEEDTPDIQKFLGNKTNYLVDESKWHNQRHMYNDCIQGIANRDTFILTRTNKVCHQPWQVFYLISRPEEMKDNEIIDVNNIKKADPGDPDSHKESKEKTVENKYADNQFFGPWYTYKTTHTITINGTDKDSAPQMIERLQMVKPFEICPVPDVIKK